MLLNIQYKGKSKILKRLAWAVNHLSQAAGGNMHTDTYDQNENGIVDNAEKVNGHAVHSDVPSNAVFTDTIYDDTALRSQVRANMNNINIIMEALFNQNVFWLVDSTGEIIYDSNGYPIFTAQYETKLNEIVTAIVELQSRKYLYWGEGE